MIRFLETGWFASNFDELTDGGRITSYGSGLRWQVTEEQPMNLGLDVAISSDDYAIYIKIGEAY